MTNLFRNNKAVTVVFGTLMMILVIIGTMTAFAYFVTMSSAKYQYEQTKLAEKNSENLQITSFRPNNNSINPDCWDEFNFTVFNSDIDDAQIRGFDVNGKYISRWILCDNSKGYICKSNSAPNVSEEYSNITVRAGQPVNVHIGAFRLNGTISGLFDDSVNLPNKTYPNMSCSGYYNITDSNNIDIQNGTFMVRNNIFIPDRPLTDLDQGNISYIMFPNDEPHFATDAGDSFRKSLPMTVNILSMRGNTYSTIFSPPISIAAMTYVGDGAFGQDIVLDGSGSKAPNGFITTYIWNIHNYSAIDSWNNTSFGIRAEFPYKRGNNYTIDLQVTDNFGMSANLSQPLTISGT